MKILTAFCLVLNLGFTAICQQVPKKAFLVCGDTKVLLVDYHASADSLPKIVWSWDAKTAPDLPDNFRTKFRTIDDCKPYGNEVLISSSSGAVAVISISSNKTVFYADAAMAHSVAMLPGGLLAAALSTHAKGNKLFLFDIKKGGLPIFSDTLYSGHGVVWGAARKSLYALGYSVLREYKLTGKNQGLILAGEWKIPGRGGHDLQMAPDGKRLFITSETDIQEFDIDAKTFNSPRGFKPVANVKSLGQSADGQFIYTIPEDSWWTYHVRFANPSRVFVFSKMKVYKARWFN